MKKELVLLLGGTLLVASLAACAPVQSSMPVHTSTPAHTSAPEPEQQMFRFTNQTEDMAVEIYADSTVLCGPGERVSFTGQTQSIRFETPEFATEQVFDLLNHYTSLTDSDYSLLLQGDAETFYSMTVQSADGAWELYYMLHPVEHYWFKSFEGRTLFLFSLPQLPMDEILALYPGAVLPDGPKEREWPDGYCDMLWSTEPLYDVRISSSGVGMDGGYAAVDWDAVEGFDLLPGQPRFHTVVHVGDAWLFALRFTDGQGRQHYYLHSYNGMGAVDLLAYPAFEVGAEDFETAQQ